MLCGDKHIVGFIGDELCPLSAFDFINGFGEKFVVGGKSFGLCEFHEEEVAGEAEGGGTQKGKEKGVMGI